VDTGIKGDRKQGYIKEYSRWWKGKYEGPGVGLFLANWRTIKEASVAGESRRGESRVKWRGGLGAGKTHQWLLSQQGLWLEFQLPLLCLFPSVLEGQGQGE